MPILARMEIAGITVDPEVLAGLSREFSQKLALLEKQIYALAGREFNINSPRQLGQILFDELHLPYGRKTKTGYSTDVKVLERLANKHDLPARILDYRTLAKLQSTYVEKLASLQDPATGRVHTSFNQAVAATGRLSSSNPNLQNIPIRSEDGNRIRQAFVPAEGIGVSVSRLFADRSAGPGPLLAGSGPDLGPSGPARISMPARPPRFSGYRRC